MPKKATGQEGQTDCYQAAMAKLDSLLKKHPAVVKIETIGSSYEQREMKAVKVADEPGEAARPEVLFTSGIHGTEVIGVQANLRLLGELVENFGKDERITRLMKTRRIWFLPVINPDRLGKRRKNAREVDLNRNFGTGFSNKGLFDRWKKWRFYPGRQPFSEPETRSVKSFLEKHRFAASVSFHSFGGAIGFPYGYQDKTARDYQLFETIAREFHQRQPYEKYRIAQMSKLYLYNRLFRMTGCLEDELYAGGTLSFLFEIVQNTSRFRKPSVLFNPFLWFNPEQEETQRHLENNIEAALFLIEIADDPRKLLRNGTA